ncbi:hypothetical protein EAG_04623 [Camponotus floridanus]|uniref:Uncharacterized protein n=1 Tax=Camponotus floridanus TaxID=104421 RepID=E2AMQ5_CAMFO|nr:hypothetical protein EAG_04623 [Camponotus floridanus]
MPTLRWFFLSRLPPVARKYAKYRRLSKRLKRSWNTKNGDVDRTAGTRTKSRTWLTKGRWATSPIYRSSSKRGDPRLRPLLVPLQRQSLLIRQRQPYTKRQHNFLTQSSARPRMIPGSRGPRSIAASMTAWWGAQHRGQSTRGTRKILAPRATRGILAPLAKIV